MLGQPNPGTGGLPPEFECLVDAIVERIGDRPAARLLTADELAHRWQVPPAHVYRLARDGRLPAVRLGRYFRFEIGAVEEFERAGGASLEAASSASVAR